MAKQKAEKTVSLVDFIGERQLKKMPLQEILDEAITAELMTEDQREYIASQYE